MKNNVNWNFDNSYSKLPDTFKENINPFSVKNPELIVLNENLATELNLNFSNLLIFLQSVSSLFHALVTLATAAYCPSVLV